MVAEVPAPLFDVVAAVDRPGISWATTPMMTAAPATALATVHRNTRRTRAEDLVPVVLNLCVMPGSSHVITTLATIVPIDHDRRMKIGSETCPGPLQAEPPPWPAQPTGDDL